MPRLLKAKDIIPGMKILRQWQPWCFTPGVVESVTLGKFDEYTVIVDQKIVFKMTQQCYVLVPDDE